MGWTVNFANPRSVMLLVVILVVCCLLVFVWGADDGAFAGVSSIQLSSQCWNLEAYAARSATGTPFDELPSHRSPSHRTSRNSKSFC